MRVMIVGPGRAGLAMGYALLHAEAVDELTVCGRQPEPPAHPMFMQRQARYLYGLERPKARTDAVLLAVPDDDLPEVVTSLAALGPSPGGTVVFHMSGGLSTDILAPLHEVEYALGSLVPLQVVTQALTSADRLRDAWFAATGDPAALNVARALCSGLGSYVLEVPAGRRPTFDAAATLASGTVPALVATISGMMASTGVDPDEAVQATVSLLEGALAGIRANGLQASIGGPIAEGDVDRVFLHLRALDGADRRLYALVGREVARIAQEEGVSVGLPEMLQRFEAELKD